MLSALAIAAIGAAVSGVPKVIDWAQVKNASKEAEKLSRYVEFSSPFGKGLYYEPDAGIRLELLSRARAAPSQDSAAIFYLLSLVVGTPYVWAGEALDGADCSGGFTLLRNLHARIVNRPLMARVTTEDISRWPTTTSLNFGDAVLYGERKPSHVETYLGDGWVVGWNGGGPERRRDSLSPDARCRIKRYDWWTPLSYHRR